MSAIITVNLNTHDANCKRHPRYTIVSAMTDYISHTFPGHCTAIRALRKKDAIFNEVCEDYEEMCTWLAAQSCSIDPDSKECRQAREIIRDLEEEIIQKLEHTK